MDSNKLSTEENWREYWASKNNIQLISDTYSYHDFIKRAVAKVKPNGNCVELGGFPGKFSVFLKKYCGLHPTLVDSYSDEAVVAELAEFNGLRREDIKCVKDDILSNTPSERYDLVCSFGLIEHFIDLKEILNAHKKYMSPGAVLLISLPNFRGVNGLLQRFFDPATLAIHNLKVMNLVLLKNVLADLGLIEIEVIYYPSTQVWLENLDRKGIFLNILLRVLNKIMIVSGGIFGNRNKIISNSIILMARSDCAYE
jgi:hypothetical protein